MAPSMAWASWKYSGVGLDRSRSIVSTGASSGAAPRGSAGDSAAPRTDDRTSARPVVLTSSGGDRQSDVLLALCPYKVLTPRCVAEHSPRGSRTTSRGTEHRGRHPGDGGDGPERGGRLPAAGRRRTGGRRDRKSTRLNSSHANISY